MSDHILYELTCGEVTFGDLDDAKRLTSRCFVHGNREGIVRVITTEWLVFCKDCKRWRRWCGMDRELAHRTSRKHWQSNPSHKPEIQKRGRYLSKMAESDLRKKVAEMEWKWYNGRIVRPGKRPELPDEPPF